jgi:hypothetical protein
VFCDSEPASFYSLKASELAQDLIDIQSFPEDRATRLDNDFEGDDSFSELLMFSEALVRSLSNIPDVTPILPENQNNPMAFFLNSFFDLCGKFQGLLDPTCDESLQDPKSITAKRLDLDTLNRLESYIELPDKKNHPGYIRVGFPELHRVEHHSSHQSALATA